MEYTTLHTLQLNGAIKRRSAVIKEIALAMLLNVKLNDTAHKMIQAEVVHTCERVLNSMATTGSTRISFEIFNG